ncbi:MAG: patatin-like phospholipase family protein [Planctomycetota bacterium]
MFRALVSSCCKLAGAMGLVLLLGSRSIGQSLPPPDAALPDVPVSDALPARPRIGLVLSGGGARGAAHIGVLEMLETLRIPVAAISGTSMGSIVGGLYAAGYSPDELQEVFRTVDWTSAFTNRPARRTLAFRRKEEDRDFFAGIDLGWKNGALRLPRGLVRGQELVTILTRLTDARRAASRFEELPIPFRCVATDLTSGETVVLSAGDLALAMRASMSVPGAFTPVEIDGRALVDGGLVQNLPVETCQAMGVDVIIAVDVGTKLRSQRDLLSLFDVSGQLAGIAIEQNDRHQRSLLGPRDVMLVPALGDFSSSDFANGGVAIEFGREAVRENVDALRHLAVSEPEWNAYLERQRRSPVPPVHVGSVRIDNESGISDEVIRRRLGITPGTLFDVARLERDIRHLYGLGYFESISYDLGVGDPADVGLRVRPRELGKGFLRVGARFEDDFDGGNRFDVATQFTLAPMNGWGGEWRSRAQVGQQVALETEFFQPLDRHGVTFVEPRVAYFEDTITLFGDGRPIVEYRVDALLGSVDLGVQLANWGELRAGVQYIDARVSPRQNLGGLFPRDRSREGSYRIRGVIDTFDDPDFPRTGIGTVQELAFVRESLGSSRDFGTYEGQALTALSFGRLTVVPSVAYGAQIEGSSSIVSTFALGGFLNLSGLPRDSRSGRYYLLAKCITYVSLGERAILPIENEAFLGGSIEFGDVYDDRRDITAENGIFAGSIFLGTKTIFGPGYLGCGFAEGGDSLFFVSFGPVF